MYDITTYTCEDGMIAKIVIPNSATEDDLRGLYELLQVVAVRRFGVDLRGEDGEAQTNLPHPYTERSEK